MQLQWSLTDDLDRFEWEGTGARAEAWEGREALRLEGFHTLPILLRERLPFDSFRLRAEVCIPGSEGFIGLEANRSLAAVGLCLNQHPIEFFRGYACPRFACAPPLPRSAGISCQFPL